MFPTLIILLSALGQCHRHWLLHKQGYLPWVHLRYRLGSFYCLSSNDVAFVKVIYVANDQDLFYLYIYICSSCLRKSIDLSLRSLSDIRRESHWHVLRTSSQWMCAWVPEITRQFMLATSTTADIPLIHTKLESFRHASHQNSTNCSSTANATNTAVDNRTSKSNPVGDTH